MKKEFAVDKWGPKRVKITYGVNLTNAEVFYDGKKIGSFATKEDFKHGNEFALPNGAKLAVRFGPVVGAPFLTGVHVLRNGVPAPGSAADPLPVWAWVFVIACAAIPVVTLGGALPGAIGGAGIGGTITAVRARRLSIAQRVGACALITVACWGAFGLLLKLLL